MDRPLAVIFDLDGTLVETESLWDEVRRALAAEDGVPYPDSATTDIMGMSTREWSAYLSDRIGLAGSPADAARRVSGGVLDAYRDGRVVVLPGAVDAVRRMAEIAPVAVASSSPARIIDAALPLLGIEDVVGVRVSTETLAHGKPAPDAYLEACLQLDVDPAACVAVEDSGSGLRSALAAGLKVVVVPPAFHPPGPELLARADLVLTDLHGLTADAVRALFL